jgi:predicted N-formylglutamate amidohydrolase
MNWAAPFEIVNPQGKTAIVIVCDHASNALPPAIGDLGVSPKDMQRHIAYDIGAAPIALQLAEFFDAPAILCGTSRLVIDCNRQLRDPTLIPPVSDGTVVPANENLTPEERGRRIDSYFHPYHNACRQMIAAQMQRGQRPLFLSIHSMTDRMNGAYRPWEISLSSNENRRATVPVLCALKAMPGFVVGDNEPYNMDPEQDYSTPEHALSRGLDYIQVEFRQDLVATRKGQDRFAEIFAEGLRKSGILSNEGF